MNKSYRENSAVIVTDGNGRVLLCYREDSPADAQTVQGGIDPGETPEDAARRELVEELGIRDSQYEFKAYLLGTHKYEWTPEIQEKLKDTGYIGQDQHFFLAEVDEDIQFDLDYRDREFDRVLWGTPERMLDEAWEAKKPGLRSALIGFQLLDEKNSE